MTTYSMFTLTFIAFVMKMNALCHLSSASLHFSLFDHYTLFSVDAKSLYHSIFVYIYLWWSSFENESLSFMLWLYQIHFIVVYTFSYDYALSIPFYSFKPWENTWLLSLICEHCLSLLLLLDSCTFKVYTPNNINNKKNMIYNSNKTWWQHYSMKENHDNMKSCL